MRVAYLILAHWQPEHLERLVSALRCNEVRFFLHIDRKADIQSFQKRLPESEHVHYLRNDARLNVNWGGFSGVKATLNLLTVARARGFDRYCLLSGSDFPLRSNYEILGRFDSKLEFMRVDRRLDSGACAHSVFVERLHFDDNRLFNRRTSRRGWLWAVGNRLLSALPARRYRRLALYHGSQWWALTDACVAYILNFLDESPDYERFHHYSHCPDEIFFHSILKSSPYAPQITHDFAAAESP